MVEVLRPEHHKTCVFVFENGGLVADRTGATYACIVALGFSLQDLKYATLAKY